WDAWRTTQTPTRLVSAICALFASFILRLPRRDSGWPPNASLCWSKGLSKKSFAKSSNAISSFAEPGTESSTESCRWMTSNGWIKQTSALPAGTLSGCTPPGTTPRRTERYGEGSLARCTRLGRLNSARVSSRRVLRRGRKRPKTEPSSCALLPRKEPRDSANLRETNLASVRACRRHRDGALFPLSLSRAELLSRADLPLGPPRLPRAQVFLHPISLHDSLHPLFLPFLRRLHLHPEKTSAREAGEASGISSGHQAQGAVRRARRGPQSANPRALRKTSLAHHPRARPVHRHRRLRRRGQRKDEYVSLSLCRADPFL